VLILIAREKYTSSGRWIFGRQCSWVWFSPW
jgi:hypothetical protein